MGPDRNRSGPDRILFTRDRSGTGPERILKESKIGPAKKQVQLRFGFVPDRFPRTVPGKQRAYLIRFSDRIQLNPLEPVPSKHRTLPNIDLPDED